MFKPDPRPNPEDVGCVVFKQCDRKCDKCESCLRFTKKLSELLPHDTQSKYRRHTFEWNDQ